MSIVGSNGKGNVMQRKVPGLSRVMLGLSPFFIALAGALALLALAGWSGVSSGVFLLLLAAGAWISRSLFSIFEQAAQPALADADEPGDMAQRAEIDKFLAGLEQLESAVTSRWVKQIESGRVQSEHALIELTRGFSDILQKLEQISQLSAGMANGNVSLDARQKAGNAEHLHAASTGLRDEISRLLMQLQFQDRVSQILGHVRDNIAAFPVYMQKEIDGYRKQGRLESIDWSGLMQQLEQSYSTAEEHDAHHENETKHAQQKPETTFF